MMELKDEPNGSVAVCGQSGLRKGKYIDSLVNNFTTAGSLQSSQDVEQRSLSHPRGPNYRNAFAVLQAKIYPSQYIDAAFTTAEMFVQSMYLKDRLGAIHSG
jgi:hypothetical protein